MKNATLCFFMLISVHLYAGEPGLFPGSVFSSYYNQHTDMAGSFIMIRKGLPCNCSDKPCDGFVTDYYDDNRTNIRMTGRFKKGFPIDTVKEYYENGMLKSLYYPYKKKYKFSGRKYNYSLLIEYDKRGNCVRYRDDAMEVEKIYRSNKSLKSALYYCRKRNVLKYYVEYYPDGVKKTVVMDANKYDYDENERLRRHWIRKSEKYNKKYGIMSASFYFEEFDVSGEVSKTGRFYSNLYDHDRWHRIFPEFPRGIEAVPVQDFREVFYPALNLKDVYRWDYANKKTIITRYEQRGDIWVESESKSLPRIEND
jgi:hypothetical protein